MNTVIIIDLLFTNDEVMLGSFKCIEVRSKSNEKRREFYKDRTEEWMNWN